MRDFRQPKVFFFFEFEPLREIENESFNIAVNLWVMEKPVLWIQIHRIWIRIHDFGPNWIRIQGYNMNFERKIQNNLREK